MATLATLATPRLPLLTLLLPFSFLVASSTAVAQTSPAPNPAASPQEPATLAPVSPPSAPSSGAPAPVPESAPGAPAVLPSPATKDAAEIAPPAPATPQTPEASRPREEAPETPVAEPKEQGHAGFAIGFSLGYAIPTGAATGAPNDDLSSVFGAQVPFALEIGGNVTPSLFLGVYGTFAPGGLAGNAGTSCTAHQLDCSANSLHGGLAIRYRFLPGEMAEPWIGYAVGYESNSFSAKNPQTSAEASGTLTGWELGHFSGGVDFLAGRNFAFGPFLDVGVGQYGHMHLEATNQPTQDADIVSSGVHEWITVGLRTVIMP